MVKSEGVSEQRDLVQIMRFQWEILRTTSDSEGEDHNIYIDLPER